MARRIRPRVRRSCLRRADDIEYFFDLRIGLAEGVEDRLMVLVLEPFAGETIGSRDCCGLIVYARDIRIPEPRQEIGTRERQFYFSEYGLPQFVMFHIGHGVYRGAKNKIGSWGARLDKKYKVLYTTPILDPWPCFGERMCIICVKPTDLDFCSVAWHSMGQCPESVVL